MPTLMNYDNEMHCPRCNEANLHHRGVSVYDRGEDDEETRLTRVNQGTLIHETVSSAINPSARRDAIVIHFECEHCGPGLQWMIVQHKGTTYTEWAV